MTSFDELTHSLLADVQAGPSPYPTTLAELDALRESVRNAPRVRPARKPGLIARMRSEWQPERGLVSGERAAA